jgi:carbon monoxide dehydrogenase subunit G
MRFENSFEVAAPVSETWALLMDVPRVVPCLPGARLVDEVGTDEWKAEVRVKVGPVTLTFDTDVTREAVDEEAHQVHLAANAREQANRGAARAKITSTVTGLDGGTRVDIGTDLQPSGVLARYGRGALEGVSAELTAEFAERLKGLLSTGENGAGATARPVPALQSSDGAISGTRLVLRALAQRIRKLFGRST